MGISHTQGMIQTLTATIKLAEIDLLARFPVQRYISMLDSQTLYGNYSNIPATAKLYCQQIRNLSDAGLLANYHKLVLLTLIAQFDTRLAKRRIPASIIELFRIEFSRIVEEIGQSPNACYGLENDRFLKDLSICRLKLYPCGPELVDELSGIPRNILVRGDFGQVCRSANFFLLQNHGFRPYYELHMHAPLRKYFHPDGWVACYRRIAELLELNSQVKGVICSSWWYDPQLETISPRLTYLRALLLDNGAQIFHIQPDSSAAYGATEKSATRLKLFKAGDYVPQIYMAIWPRQELINWATQLGQILLHHGSDVEP